MGTRPILGGNTPQEQQTSTVSMAESQNLQAPTTDMPLAVELPSWDLVPADTLLVRRRPIRK